MNSVQQCTEDQRRVPSKSIVYGGLGASLADDRKIGGYYARSEIASRHKASNPIQQDRVLCGDLNLLGVLMHRPCSVASAGGYLAKLIADVGLNGTYVVVAKQP